MVCVVLLNRRFDIGHLAGGETVITQSGRADTDVARGGINFYGPLGMVAACTGARLKTERVEPNKIAEAAVVQIPRCFYASGEENICAAIDKSDMAGLGVVHLEMGLKRLARLGRERCRPNRFAAY